MRQIPLILALLFVGVSACVGCRSVEPIRVEALTDRYDAARFAVAVHALEENCALNAPYVVNVRVIHANVWGQTGWRPALGMYVIDIESRNTMHGIIDVLIHEWAHAMVWDASADEVYDYHGPLWGVAQARAYRVVLTALLAYNAEQAALQAQPEAGDPSLGPCVGVGVQLGE